MTNQVENFIVQYEKENQAQEVNANKRVLNGILWFLVAIVLLWILTLTDTLDIGKNMATSAFFLSFLLYLPCLFLIYRGNLSHSWIKYYLLALLSVITAAFVALLSYYATLLLVFPLLYAIPYRDKKIIRFAFIVSTLTMIAGTLIGLYSGIFDLNLLPENHHTLDWYLSNTIASTLLLPINTSLLLSRLIYRILLQMLMLLILSVMLQYTVTGNTRDALRIAQLTYHKDTDANTKVFNKNKYEEMLASYYPSVTRLAVIFFDLNNLKKVNDEFGHAMGDYIIETLASVIRNQSNDGRRAYRIGGDEFVMILENPAKGEAELLIAAIKEELSLLNETGPVTVSTAAGFAYGKGSNILEVVKEADEKMYENKLFIKNLEK